MHVIECLDTSLGLTLLLFGFRYELPNKAPSYFHWIYNQPCTTNDLYGYSQKAYPNKPHPERPKNFFDKIRPFSPLGFYPDLRNDWTLSAAHTRAGPRFSKRPSRTFCPRAVLNRYNIMNGYVPEHIPAIDRVEVPDLPRGVHVYMPDCEPTPPYCRPKPRARVNLMWNILPGVVTHNKSHPGIPEDKVYSTPIPRRPPHPWINKVQK